MREKKHGLQLLFIVMAMCHLLFPVNYVYGKKAVEMPVRPFALNPENRHLRLDGIFDTRADIHGIGIYLENVGDTRIENVTATASFAPGSGIVMLKDSEKFENLAPGNPLFGYFQASFAASSPGKYPLILEVSGDSFKQTIKRDVYVIRSETDPHDPYQWTVKTPEGTLTTKVRELYRSDKLGSSAAVKTYKWVVEYIDRPEGQFSALPYSDPWWKVIGSIVPVGGPPTIIDSQIENMYGPGLGDTVKSVGRAAFTTSALVVTSNKTDPFRRGQEETKPGPDDATIKEEVEVSLEYLAEPMVGKPYRADVQWTYTRSTKVQEYRYKFKQKVRNTHSSGKSPKVKFKRRKFAGGQDFLITARTRSPKLRNNEAYFVANLFNADDTRYKNVVQSMVLQDNGLQGDRKAGDGIYTAVASADRFPPEPLPNVLVFGFDINRAAESDPPEIAAAKLGGVLISAPSSILLLPGKPGKPKKDEKKDSREKSKPGETAEKPPKPSVPGGSPGRSISSIFRIDHITIDGWGSLELGNTGKGGAVISGAGNIQKAVSGSFSGGVKLSLGHKVKVLSKSHVIGISIGYGIRLKGSLSLEGDEIEADGQLSTYAIPVELFYHMPVGKNSFFRVASGVDFYKAKIKNPLEPLAGSALGGHLSLETGIKLGKKFAGTLNVGYLLAKLKEFKTSDGKTPVENLLLDLRGMKFSFGFRFRLK